MKILKRYLNKIGKKFRIEKTILFGSRAKGDWKNESDIDLIVVSSDFSGINFRKRVVEVIGDWNENIDLEVFCYTPEEFEKKKNRISIVSEALKEGVIIK
jgi:predicted nucleotidyltransferase